MTRWAGPVLVLLALPGCEDSAPDQGVRGGIEVLGGYAYAPVATEAAAYISISNRGKVEDTLLAVTSSLAGKVTLHESRSDGARVRMEELGRLELPAGTSIEMAPGALHLMLTDLKVPLAAGRRLPLSLSFARAGILEVWVPIERYGSTP